jgi:hypothetical protein
MFAQVFDEAMSEIDTLRKRIAELEAALKPFAKFAEAMTQMGGNHPKTGDFYTLRVGGEPVTLTVEDFKAATAALSK